jgi:hypothetical protein
MYKYNFRKPGDKEPKKKSIKEIGIDPNVKNAFVYFGNLRLYISYYLLVLERLYLIFQKPIF